MTTQYAAPYTATVNVADVARAGLAALPSPPDVYGFVAPNQFVVVYNAIVLTGPQQAAFVAAVAGAAADPTAPWYVAAALQDNVAGALVRLRQIQTQATAFQGQGAYGVANLANLNDLLAKSQTMAGAIRDVATDLIAIARILSNQLDGTA